MLSRGGAESRFSPSGGFVSTYDTIGSGTPLLMRNLMVDQSDVESPVHGEYHAGHAQRSNCSKDSLRSMRSHQDQVDSPLACVGLDSSHSAAVKPDYDEDLPQQRGQRQMGYDTADMCSPQNVAQMARIASHYGQPQHHHVLTSNDRGGLSDCSTDSPEANGSMADRMNHFGGHHSAARTSYGRHSSGPVGTHNVLHPNSICASGDEDYDSPHHSHVGASPTAVAGNRGFLSGSSVGSVSPATPDHFNQPIPSSYMSAAHLQPTPHLHHQHNSHHHQSHMHPPPHHQSDSEGTRNDPHRYSIAASMDVGHLDASGSNCQQTQSPHSAQHAASVTSLIPSDPTCMAGYDDRLSYAMPAGGGGDASSRSYSGSHLVSHKAVAFLAGPRERIHVFGNPIEYCPRCFDEGLGNVGWRPHRHIGELKVRYICERKFDDLESAHHFDIPLCPLCGQVLYLYEFNVMLGVGSARRLHKYVLKCATRHILPLLDIFCQTKKGGEKCNSNFKLQWSYGTMVKRCASQKNRDHDLWWVRYKNEWKQRRTIIRYKKDFLRHLADVQRAVLLGLGTEGEAPPDPKYVLGPTYDALVAAAGGAPASPKIKKRRGDHLLKHDDFSLDDSSPKRQRRNNEMRLGLLPSYQPRPQGSLTPHGITHNNNHHPQHHHIPQQHHQIAMMQQASKQLPPGGSGGGPAEYSIADCTTAGYAIASSDLLSPTAAVGVGNVSTGGLSSNGLLLGEDLRVFHPAMRSNVGSPAIQMSHSTAAGGIMHAATESQINLNA